MGFESFSQGPSQEQIAKDYLAAYEEYKKLAEQAVNAGTVAYKLEDEAAPQHMIDEQRAEARTLSDEADRAMKRYAAIGEGLTPESKDKYLK